MERLVKANSKKEVRDTFNADVVELWCNITKKNESLYSNLPVANGKKHHTYYGVEISYLDNGKVAMAIVTSGLAVTRPENTLDKCKKADLVWFGSKKEALTFIELNSK